MFLEQWRGKNLGCVEKHDTDRNSNESLTVFNQCESHYYLYLLLDFNCNNESDIFTLGFHFSIVSRCFRGDLPLNN